MGYFQNHAVLPDDESGSKFFFAIISVFFNSLLLLFSLSYHFNLYLSCPSLFISPCASLFHVGYIYLVFEQFVVAYLNLCVFAQPHLTFYCMKN
jgi:hypothetical protein